MKLLILLTADHAYIDSMTGKLYVLGAFNVVYVSKVPAQHDRMSLVIRVTASLGDRTDEQMLTAILMDEDGGEILKLAAQFRLPISSDGSRPYFDMVGELGGVVFPHPGKYVFRVYIDDEEVGTTPIDIVLKEK